MESKLPLYAQLAHQTGSWQVNKILHEVFLRERVANLGDDKDYVNMIEEIQVRVQQRHAIILELESFGCHRSVIKPLKYLRSAQRDDLDEIDCLIERRKASLRRAAKNSRDKDLESDIRKVYVKFADSIIELDGFIKEISVMKDSVVAVETAKFLRTRLFKDTHTMTDLMVARREAEVSQREKDAFADKLKATTTIRSDDDVQVFKKIVLGSPADVQTIIVDLANKTPVVDLDQHDQLEMPDLNFMLIPPIPATSQDIVPCDDKGGFFAGRSISLTKNILDVYECFYLFIEHEYEAKVIVRSKLKYLSLIREKLNEKRRILFRETCFGPWLDILFFDHETHMLDYILQKQCYVDDAHYDMPLIYHVAGRSIHFGQPEFHLITWFRFGKFVSGHSYSSRDIKFKARIFPKNKGGKLHNLDLLGVLEDEELFGKLSDDDAVRLCLLFVLEIIFMDWLLTEQVDDKLLRFVEDLQAWNSFPWGEHIWRQLYNQILNVVARHRFQHLKGLETSLKFVSTYTLSGFVWAFKEAKINFDLKATLVEQQSDLYIQSRDYMLKIEVKSLITEIGVKDCVIQKLNTRVFKLESIIQVLACERTCGFRVQSFFRTEKLDYSRSFSLLSSEFQEQLKREFGELADTLISSRQSAQIHVDYDDDIVQVICLSKEYEA
ncbi:phospholipase-like protein [Artemisia annua]|uniref:Phospholipase-like protein n=1 Tax=Artemisia annua TaxID=35608 RepID=A0A2U1MFP9_ARTAN|nr:phospholipase-like protein [Artemisia annua]